MAAVILSPPHDVAGARKGRRRGRGGERRDDERRKEEEDQLSLLTMLVAAVRKSLGGCRTDSGDENESMEISSPTNFRHVVHVTFDRFNGFLGLPVELEPEVPLRPPSARFVPFSFLFVEIFLCSGPDFNSDSVSHQRVNV